MCKSLLIAPVLSLVLLLCAAGARADNIQITIINATFEAPCVGGTGTCTEVINGYFDFDTATNMGTGGSPHPYRNFGRHIHRWPRSMLGD